MWLQKTVTLARKDRGFHLVTDEILRHLPELRRFAVGRAHIFIQHTSASISINENADPDVRGDMERWFNHAVPQGAPYFEHTCEGPDDMPAHIKSTLVGCEVTVPITRGRLALGTWQGLYLGEHRDHAGPRDLVVTLAGEESSP